MKPFLRHISAVIASALAAILVSACGGEPDYPPLLTTADSAYLAGDYRLADSLLAAYKPDGNESKAVGMYRLLVETEQKYFNDSLSTDDYVSADSLCLYYDDKGIKEKEAKALLFKGNVCKKSYDNPSAIDCFLQALDLSEEVGLLRLQCLACRELGDIYFDQRMLDECTPYYKRYYSLAEQCNDLRRMALASFTMGRVYTIYNNVDSAVFYYRQAIEMGKQLPGSSDIVSYATQNLSDVYIQIEEYELADSLMKYSPHDANRAYWHLGQGNIDSAIVYFQKLEGRYGWIMEVERLGMLARIEQERQNYKAATEYYNQLCTAEDSLKVTSQQSETRRTAAQYNYDAMKAQRDDEKKRNDILQFRLRVLMAIITLLIVIIMLALRSYRLKRNEARARHYALQQELERQRQMSQEKTEILQLQNTKTQEELLKSDIVRRIMASNTTDTKRLTNNEWHELHLLVDNAYSGFTDRLRSLATLTDTEMHICYLIKLGIQPGDMSEILCKSKSAISMARKRMCKKLLGHDDKPSEIDRFIERF